MGGECLSYCTVISTLRQVPACRRGWATNQPTNQPNNQPTNQPTSVHSAFACVHARRPTPLHLYKHNEYLTSSQPDHMCLCARVSYDPLPLHVQSFLNPIFPHLDIWISAGENNLLLHPHSETLCGAALPFAVRKTKFLAFWISFR